MTDGRRHPYSNRTKKIWSIYNDNPALSNPAIAKLVGTTPNIVAHAINRGKASGHCRHRPKTKATVLNSASITSGCIGQVIKALDVQQTQWLFDEAQSCACLTAAEYIAELVLDAYEEAMAKEVSQ
tara:strand:- start:19 stop:396 length:378 start_codon:yes stop_codon:yes gene_type:complete